MTAAEWFYGGFWLMLGGGLAWYSVWGMVFFAVYAYGFTKGLFK